MRMRCRSAACCRWRWARRWCRRSRSRRRPTIRASGSRPGLRDAGVAARNMELVANLPKPEGFFDPKAPAGSVDAARARRPAERRPPQPPDGATPPPPPPRGAGFTNSDLAFNGNHAVVGNYHGFNTYDIENARRPRLLASVVCPGGQGDVSIHGNLLFMSVRADARPARLRHAGRDGRRSAPSASAASASSTSATCKNPKQVAAVQTCRGSHTHTLVTDPKDKANIYVYGSGTGRCAPARSWRAARA